MGFFDTGSKVMYCIETMKDKVNLKLSRSEVTSTKRFAAEEGLLKRIDVVQICVKSQTKSAGVYVEVLYTFFLYLFIQGQKYKQLTHYKM